MKVLLISANTTNAPHSVYPLGLDYVAGALTPRHEVRILDMNRAAAPEHLEAEIRDGGRVRSAIARLRNADLLLEMPLNDEGRDGDLAAGDGVFTLQTSVSTRIGLGAEGLPSKRIWE